MLIVKLTHDGSGVKFWHSKGACVGEHPQSLTAQYALPPCHNPHPSTSQYIVQMCEPTEQVFLNEIY